MGIRFRGAPGFTPERLVAARKEIGLRQQDLAESVGVKRLYITALERGTRLPSPPVLLSISKALNVQPLWLLSAEGDPTMVQLRFAAGLYQREASSVLGISDTLLSQYEMGALEIPEEIFCYTHALYLTNEGVAQKAAKKTLNLNKKTANRPTGPRGLRRKQI